MKTIKLTKDTYLYGRLRRKGEVVPVEDSFDGEVVSRDIEKKNRQKHRKPEKKEHKKEKHEKEHEKKPKKLKRKHAKAK